MGKVQVGEERNLSYLKFILCIYNVFILQCESDNIRIIGGVEPRRRSYLYDVNDRRGIIGGNKKKPFPL